MAKQAAFETEFEKPRGVSTVEVRGGYAQVHVTNLAEPLADSRLRVLAAIADARISLDFLKLTQSGLSFLIQETQSTMASMALNSVSVDSQIKGGRSIVLVHAANLRDEEGLLAKLVSVAIGCGVAMEHLSDMHDRMLLVTDDGGATRLAKEFESRFVGVTNG